MLSLSLLLPGMSKSCAGVSLLLEEVYTVYQHRGGYVTKEGVMLRKIVLYKRQNNLEPEVTQP